MKKNTKIYVISFSAFIISIIFMWSKGQSYNTELKDSYDKYQKINEILSSGENIEEAEKLLKDIEDDFIENPEIYLKKALVSVELEKYEEAEKFINKMFELEPRLENNADVLNLYAQVLYEKGDIDKANAILNKVNELGKTSE